MFVLAAVSSVITIIAQQSGGALASIDHLPLYVRMINTVVSYVSYIGKMIRPLKLAIFYPHTGMLPIWQAAGAGLLLVCISVLVIRAGRRAPYLSAGWLWYLGTLVPVIGFVQVGAQSMADRYTYLPLIGLFVMIAWGVADLTARWRYRSIALSVSTGVMLLAFAICTWFQVGYWKNSIALFTHTLNATADNYLAHNYLGLALAEEERSEEAISHYCEAVRIKPDFAEARINLGKGYFGQGDVDGAIAELRRAILLAPRSPEAHYNLGIAYGSKGLYNKAFQEIRMSKVLSSKGKWDLIRKKMKTTSSQKAPH